MDMLTQIQKFPYLNALPAYIFLGLGAEYKRQTKITLLISLYIQNNNGTGPD
jgi:hypothetical protein